MILQLLEQVPDYKMGYVLAYLQGITADEGTGERETRELLSLPGMKEKLTEGKKTPLSDCVPGSEVVW